MGEVLGVGSDGTTFAISNIPTNTAEEIPQTGESD